MWLEDAFLGEDLFGMGIFGRYIFRLNASALALILMSLTGILWIAMALKQLSLLTSKGQSSLIFFKMTMLALPNLLVVIAPIALLIATIHTLNRLNGDSELIILNAGGGHIGKIMAPLLSLAAIFSVLILLSNAYIMPWSQRTLHSYVTQVRTDMISQVLQPGKFSSAEKGLTFHIRNRTLAGELQGLVMADTRDAKLHLTYLAERGNIVKQDGQSYLVMFNGHIIRRDPGKNGARIVIFEKYIIDLSKFGPKSGTARLKPSALYLHELWTPDPKTWTYIHYKGKMRAELHERLANPLYPIIFVLVAIASLGQAQTTRQNRVRNVVSAFGLAAGARLVGLAGTNLASAQAWAIILIYAVPILVGSSALFVAYYKLSPRPRSAISRKIDQMFDTMIARMSGNQKDDNDDDAKDQSAFQSTAPEQSR